MEFKVFDPNSVIAQAIEEIRPAADKKGLAFNLELLDTPVAINADENRLKQVLINLAGNAVKYTEKGSVTVSLQAKKSELLITVADTGMGISSEEQANLFQRFYRIKNEKTKDIIGTGLGLWLTLEIVKRMKGKITVESIEGVGSHFTVHFPLAEK